MRFTAATLLTALALVLGAVPVALAQPTSAAASRTLTRSLGTGMRKAGDFSGAQVVDLTTGQTLYAANAGAPRLPASVEKLFTTTTALQRFGPNASLTTSILGTGRQHGSTYDGTLYLRGAGDPTFGSASFDHASYGTGSTMQHLVSNFVHATGIHTLKGSIVGDETFLDADRGTPATGNRPSTEVEGELSGLVYDRGWLNTSGTVLIPHPALTGAADLALALKAAGVKLAGHPRIAAGATPAGATTLASAGSPRIATLVALTNTPSDNFFAEMLLKDIGARFGTAGSTAAGAAVVRAQMASSFGIHPRLDDGSGLSRYDRTTPQQVVTLLRQMAGNAAFTGSLAVAGETGTLVDEMRHTYAQGRCRGKTGTLHDVSNVVGYCRAQDGHTLAYALMMNGVNPTAAHPLQNTMQVAIARYDG
jgi:D-alanyl-D-alanine carboxypeptidase/D-alanyl-D-alanine-endopeptidase (penicillin-binding protein 4)